MIASPTTRIKAERFALEVVLHHGLGMKPSQEAPTSGWRSSWRGVAMSRRQWRRPESAIQTLGDLISLRVLRE
jgi:hypothetical protein